ncbi:MAG: UDP-N-acetylglucosamine--N-acetylmuramyl-(pentapeptide) pyrophosphoryl-undecaprenol N-acetylglucosamine transferase [Myxococcales bacterium]|nr:UDP-N-acetylglucosamine--N-acetylmuramyl-(pentapeptide) pyrophosphoryl-undecaprenol N-acetylglucosamine transferase [Myxococcales bacterium]
MPHTILLAGGGTGGHVYPALAMGDALRARGHNVLYFGEASRLEGRVAPQRGYVFRAVEAAAFPRAGLLAKVRFAFGLVRTAWKTRGLVKAEGATLVLGVGGYVMAPTVLGAALLGVPSVIHEANVTPGLANRLCARVARLVLLTFAETASKIPGRVERILVGCPVNPKVLDGTREAAAARYGLDPERPTLLIVGGSLGAATINQVALAAALAWCRGPDEGSSGPQILHITGPRYHAEVLEGYRRAFSTAGIGAELPPSLCVRDYEDKMGEAYAMADLALCRAGSSTLSELCALGKPSVLIPSPNVTDNHQEGNARGLERVGAACVFVEKGLEVEGAVAAMRTLLGEPGKLNAMSEAARKLGQLGAAERVADLIEARFPS